MKTLHLTVREMRLGMIAAALLVVVGGYALIIDGYLPARAELSSALDQETAKYTRLKRLASQLEDEGSAGIQPEPETAPTVTSESDLIEAIYASAGNQMRLRSVEPRYINDQLELSLSGAGPAQAAGNLLHHLETLGGSVQDTRLTATPSRPGTVTLNATCRFDDVRK